MLLRTGFMLNSIGNNVFIMLDSWMLWVYGTIQDQDILEVNALV